MKIIIFDTETSGINLKWNTILQLSYQVFDTLTETIDKEVNLFFDYPTDDKVSPGAIETNELTKEVIASKETISISTGIKEFLNDLYGKDAVVGHNVGFDIRAVIYEGEKVGISNIQWPVIYDTMLRTVDLAKVDYPKKRRGHKPPKLIELAQFLNVSMEGIKPHDSSCDVELTKRCYVTLMHMGFIKISDFVRFVSVEDPLGKNPTFTKISLSSPPFDFRELLKNLYEKEDGKPFNIEMKEFINAVDYSLWNKSTTIENFVGRQVEYLGELNYLNSYREFLVMAIIKHNQFLCISSEFYKTKLRNYKFPTSDFEYHEENWIELCKHEISDPYLDLLKRCINKYVQKNPWNDILMLKFLCLKSLKDNTEQFIPGIEFDMRKDPDFKELTYRNRQYIYSGRYFNNLLNGKL